MPGYNTGLEVIQAFMRALDETTQQGKSALDQAIRACSDYEGIDDLISNFVSDCRNAIDGSAFLKDYCGIILENEDTGAITGFDAGGSTVKTKESVVPEEGGVQEFTGTTFVKSGLTVRVPNASALDAAQKKILNGLYTWWVSEGLKLISTSYGANYSFTTSGSATVSEITAYFDEDLGEVFAYVSHRYDRTSGEAISLELHVNMSMYGELSDEVNGLGTNANAGYLDRVLAHELTHAVMAANVTNFNKLPQCIKEGLAELTHGTDDLRTDTIKKLANDSALLESSVDVSGTAAKNRDAYAGGYMLLRYLAKQASGVGGNAIVNAKSEAVVNGTSAAEYIFNQKGGTRSTIFAGLGNDTVDNRGDNAYINGGAGDDSINSGADAEYGWSVTMLGGLGSDTLTGSSYADVFEYARGDGHDVITDYDANDTIRINSGELRSTVLSGSDVIVSIEGGSIRLKNASGKALNLSDANGARLSVGSKEASFRTITNTTTNTVVNGTNGDDTMRNYAGGVTVRGGIGNDSIVSSTNSNYTVEGGYGYVTLDGGYGNDTLIGNDPNMSLSGGADDDWLETGAWENVTMRGGSGDDTLRGSTRGTLYQYASGDGDDVITNLSDADTLQVLSGSIGKTVLSGSDVIVSIGSGSIRLQNASGKTLRMIDAEGRAITLESESGAIENTTPNTLLSGTEGRDTLRNGAGGVTIEGGGGADSIYSATNARYTINGGYGYVTIDGGAGNDVIENYDPNVSINGGSGNDAIFNEKSNVTVVGGLGNDTLRGSGSGRVYRYGAGDGNDVIYGFTGRDSLQLMNLTVSGADTADADLIVNVEGGSITLKNALGENLNLVDANGNKLMRGDETRVIKNVTPNSVVSGSSGADTIENAVGGVTIRAGGGADSIYNSTDLNLTVNGDYGYVTISGGDGADTIENYDPNVSINGGSGRDVIEIFSYGSTVRGGAGADTIVSNGQGNVLQYGRGDGSDLIISEGNGDTLRLTEGLKYSTVRSDAHLLVSIGSGLITIQNAAQTGFAIEGGEFIPTNGRRIENTVSNATVTGTTFDDTIGNAGTNVTIEGGLGDDVITLSGSEQVIRYASGDGNDVVFGFDGDVLSIADGAEYVTVSNGLDLMVSIGSGFLTLKGAVMTASIEGGSLVGLPSEAQSIRNINRNVPVIGGDGADTIENAAGGVQIFGGLGDDIIFTSTESRYTVEGVYGNVTVDAGGGADTIENIDPYVSIDGGSGDDVIDTWGFEAVTIRGGLGDDSIRLNGRRSVVEYAWGDGADTVEGFDEDTTLKLDGSGYSTAVSGSDVIVNVGSGSIKLLDAVGKELNVVGGVANVGLYALTNTASNTIVNGTSGADSIVNVGSNVTINAGDGDDVIENGGERASLHGGAGDDTIVSNRSATMRGGAGDDVLTGSDGADVYLYARGDGNDLITNFGESDTLRLTDGSSFTTVESGSDVLIEAGTNVITLKGAAGTSLNITNGAARTYNVIYNATRGETVRGTDGADVIYNGASVVTLDGGAGDDIIENDHGDSISIDGGSGDDVIRNRANGWNVTMRGGLGDDTLIGGGYYKIYEYASGDGDDVIDGYELTDTIRITDGSEYSTIRSGDDLIVSIGSGSMLIKGAADLSVRIDKGDSAGAIKNMKALAFVSGTSEGDSIYNAAELVTINAGGGDDTIEAHLGRRVSIYAGAGDDYVYGNAGRWYNTLNGGEGDDTLDFHGTPKVVEYASGDGNDVITAWYADDTLRLTDGAEYSTLQSGSDLIVSIGSGSIVLKDAVGTPLNVIRDGATDRNVIVNEESNVLMSGTSENDSILNVYGMRVTIDAGAGDDVIDNRGDYASIDGGDGADSIFNGEEIWGWNSTMRGGKGDDTIAGTGGANVFQYADGDGNDLITGWDSTDWLLITDGADFELQTLDADVIVSIGSGRITLTGAANATVNIDNGKVLGGAIINRSNAVTVYGTAGADHIINTTEGTNSTLNGLDGDDTIDNRGDFASIIGGAGDDVIIGNGADDWGWFSTIRGGSGADTITGSTKYNVFEYESGDGSDVITNWNDKDTLALIDGSEYRTLRSGEDLTVSIGSGSIVFKDAAEKTLMIDDEVKRGLNVIENALSKVTVFGTDAADSIVNDGDDVTIRAGLGDDVIDGAGGRRLIEYAAGDGADFIANFGSSDTLWLTDGSAYQTLLTFNDNVMVLLDGVMLTLGGAVGAELNITNEVRANVISLTASNTVMVGTAGTDSMMIDGSNVTIDAGKGDDTIGGAGDNRTYRYAAGDGNDVIIGCDSDDTVMLDAGMEYTTLANGADVLILTEGGILMLVDAAGEELNIDAGAGRINVVSNALSNTVIEGTTGADSIENTASGVTIDAASGNDTVNSYGSGVFIDGGSGIDRIYASSYPNVTIRGGSGNDVLTGDGTHKVYLYADGDGNDLITGFDGTDTIEFEDAVYYSTLVSGTDVIINAGWGSMVLTDAAGLAVNVVGGISRGDYIINDAAETVVNGTSASDTIENSGAYATIDCDAGSDYVINGAEYAKIYGGDGFDVIDVQSTNVYVAGGARNDEIANVGSGSTVRGGLGDDSIGGLGKGRVYVYASGDGEDVIDGYDESDLISIESGNVSTLESGTDAIVIIDDGRIVLRNALGKALNLVGSGATLNANMKYVTDGVMNNESDDVTIMGSDGADSVVNTGSNVFVLESEGANTLENAGVYAFVQGGADADVIMNTGGEAYLNGGDGDDTLRTVVDANLMGGAGADRFEIRSDGSSEEALLVNVLDLTEEDMLSIEAPNSTGFLYQIRNGSLRLTDDTGQVELSAVGVANFEEVSNVAVEFINSSGTIRTTLGELATEDPRLPEGVKLSASGKVLTVKTPFTGAITAADYGDEVRTINASSNDNAVLLHGNELDNVLKASKGGSMLDGGGGKDVLICGAGADMILYSSGDGADVVKRFDGDEDKLLLAGVEINSVIIKGKNVVLDFGSGSMTIQKAVGEPLMILSREANAQYVFTKENNTLEKALVATLGEQPTEDYWFEQSAEANDELQSILSTELVSTGQFSTEEFSRELFNRLDGGMLVEPRGKFRSNTRSK